MNRRAYRLTKDVVTPDGTPIILAGTLAVTSKDGERVLFSRALPIFPYLIDAPPLFEINFLNQIKDKLDIIPFDEIPEWLQEVDQTKDLPLLGWALL